MKSARGGALLRRRKARRDVVAARDRCQVQARTFCQWQSSWNKAPIRAASREASAVSKAASQSSAELRACSAA